MLRGVQTDVLSSNYLHDKCEKQLTLVTFFTTLNEKIMMKSGVGYVQAKPSLENIQNSSHRLFVKVQIVCLGKTVIINTMVGLGWSVIRNGINLLCRYQKTTLTTVLRTFCGVFSSFPLRDTNLFVYT